MIGGALPVAVAADWLTSAWDQNGGGYVVAPALSVAEEVAAGWIGELLGLPAGCGIGFVTGCQMAHFTCLAAARHAVLRDAGWDVEANGLQGGPQVRVLAGEQAHVTVGVASRMLGLGYDRVRTIGADDQGRMLADELPDPRSARRDGPTIVCAQAGELNTGAFDPIARIVRPVPGRRRLVSYRRCVRALGGGRARPAAACSTGSSGPTRGRRMATNGSTSPMTAGSRSSPTRAGSPGGDDPRPRPLHPGSRRGHPRGDTTGRRSSRGARAGCRSTRRCARSAGTASRRSSTAAATTPRRMASTLAAAYGVEVLNEVVLNQVLVRFGDSDDVTEAVIDRVQRDGTCWLGGSSFRGRAVMRISIVGWQTTADDVDRSAESILRAAGARST